MHGCSYTHGLLMMMVDSITASLNLMYCTYIYTGLVSGRFYKLKTTVYSILRMWIGVGLMIHFALSIVLPHDVLLWIIVATAGVGIPLYGLVDWQWKFSPC